MQSIRTQRIADALVPELKRQEGGMDWKDSPQQAAFRAEVRGVIETRLPPRYRELAAAGEVEITRLGVRQKIRRLSSP